VAQLLQLAGKPRPDASSSDLLAEVLEKAMQRNAWLLINGLLDSMHPDAILRLVGLTSATRARSGDTFTTDPQSFPVPPPRSRGAGDARGGQDGNGLRAHRLSGQKGRPRFGGLREGFT